MSDDNTWGPGDFAVGSQIAGYRLEEQIGRGGMAVVFRALDIRLDRRVALKILAPGLALDDAFRQRFIRESRAAAAVDHPNIIPVFEAGEANGVLFIAMRYVLGGDVRSLLDSGGPLPGARAADIVAQVASALDAAHAFGLVHRDVKPGNMLLGSTSGSERQDHVYLSDFGLSKQSLAVTGLTSTGQFLGTIDYVAPEQIEGRPVDGRADLYSLACAAFEMLGGSPPFRRDQGLAVVWAQLSEPPPSLRARRQDLPSEVDAVFAKAMAKTPADRYPTCLAFAVALREALGLRGRPAGPAGPVAGPGGTVAAGPSAARGPQRHHPATEISTPGARAGAGTGAAGTGAAGTGQPGQFPGAGVPDQTGQPAAAAGTGQPGRQAGAGGTGQPGQPGRFPAVGGTGQPGQPPVSAGPPTEEVRRPSHPTRPDPTEPPGGHPPQGYGGYPGDQGGYARARRPWWRTPAAVIIACVIVLGAAGGAYAVLGGGGHRSGSNGSGTKPVVTMPGCNAEIASAPTLRVQTATTHTGGAPFGVRTTHDGNFSFVTLGNSIALLRNGSGLAPTLIRTFSAPGAKKSLALTHDGKYVIAASSSGAYVISVAAAEQGSTSPIVGTLTSTFGHDAVEVAVAPGDKFVFVTLEDSAAMAVFNLSSALTNGFGPSDVVGEIKLGYAPVGMAISPDGNWLYVTSMMRVKTPNPSEGTLTVIDLHRAQTKPASAVKSVATAGCGAARVTASPDGKDVWVTSRESDAVLGFSAAKLRTDPAHSLIARVDVGAAPIGLVMVNNGSRILVANSNVRGQPGAVPSVAVISTSAALNGGHALLGLIKTGQVPREFGLEPGGKTVLVTNNNSGLVQAIAVSSLP